ncbi:hypothetical protein K502DRAFT_333960 [Neoconidiobolus thromboides FSU 785]|nr:hypothetical protein K502DRAFT_333960 [Neoconidiobolus thromboides FSU 785]
MEIKLYSLLALCVTSHMEIQSPAPRRSQYSSYYQSKDDVDWDLNAPHGTSDHFDYPFPCKGAKQGPAQATYAAGSTINVQFADVAGANKHDGGHCQFGISYDNAKTIVVLKTVIRECFRQGITFPVTIPADAPPANNAVLTWTWINAIGNREYYMNCVDIKITGGKVGGSITGPQNLVGNLPGYPLFPEFYQGDRRELFDKRPIITIKP